MAFAASSPWLVRPCRPSNGFFHQGDLCRLIFTDNQVQSAVQRKTISQHPDLAVGTPSELKRPYFLLAGRRKARYQARVEMILAYDEVRE